MPDFDIEHSFDGRVAGIDEAGRGPWAGPVVAAAVILPIDPMPATLLSRLDDSKKVRKPVREALLGELRTIAEIGIGVASPAEIDELNILQATMLAMRRACANLPVAPAAAIIDGNRDPGLACETRTVVKGDAKSFSIAAASIAAKVTRDRLMAALAQKHPGYGWERNAGYGTAEHKAGLLSLGVTPEHRRSFAPIQKILTRCSD